ncbi:MAG: PilZ domain-containing protein [Acidiferrobacterales bacterium]
MMKDAKSTERRDGPRRPTTVKVMVTHPRLGLIKCKLRDLSLDGAFIETEEFSLPKSIDVDLVLKIRSGDKTMHCRVPAKVARVDEEGAALVFSDLDERVYRRLFDIVHSQ